MPPDSSFSKPAQHLPLARTMTEALSLTKFRSPCYAGESHSDCNESTPLRACAKWSKLAGPLTTGTAFGEMALGEMG